MGADGPILRAVIPCGVSSGILSGRLGPAGPRLFRSGGGRCPPLRLPPGLRVPPGVFPPGGCGVASAVRPRAALGPSRPGPFPRGPGPSPPVGPLSGAVLGSGLGRRPPRVGRLRLPRRPFFPPSLRALGLGRFVPRSGPCGPPSALFGLSGAAAPSGPARPPGAGRGGLRAARSGLRAPPGGWVSPAAAGVAARRSGLRCLARCACAAAAAWPPLRSARRAASALRAVIVSKGAGSVCKLPSAACTPSGHNMNKTALYFV